MSPTPSAFWPRPVPQAVAPGTPSGPWVRFAVAIGPSDTSAQGAVSGKNLTRDTSPFNAFLLIAVAHNLPLWVRLGSYPVAITQLFPRLRIPKDSFRPRRARMWQFPPHGTLTYICLYFF